MNNNYTAACRSPHGICYSAGYRVVLDLRDAAREYGASEAELAAIARLVDGRAERVDLERLEPLAGLARLPWRELYPEL